MSAFAAVRHVVNGFDIPTWEGGAGPTLLAFQLDGVSMPDPGDGWQVMRLGVAASGVEIVDA